MTAKAKRVLLFVDAVEAGTARLLPENGLAFELPSALLPDGTREGCRVELTAKLCGGCDADRDEIDSLLDELGDDPWEAMDKHGFY